MHHDIFSLLTIRESWVTRTLWSYTKSQRLHVNNCIKLSASNFRLRVAQSSGAKRRGKLRQAALQAKCTEVGNPQSNATQEARRGSAQKVIHIKDNARTGGSCHRAGGGKVTADKYRASSKCLGCRRCRCKCRPPWAQHSVLAARLISYLYWRHRQQTWLRFWG